MREYGFKLKENEQLIWSLYIHWINPRDPEGKNYLVGRVSFVGDGPKQRFIIEYFSDLLPSLQEMGFERISGCNPNKGRRVWEYPYGRLPVFIEERQINPKRNDLYFWLNKWGLTYYDRYEFFRRSHAMCSDNFLFLSDKEDETHYWNEFKHGYVLGIPNPNKLENK